MKQPINTNLQPGFSQTITKLFVILGLTVLLMLLWSTPVALARVQFSEKASQWVYQSQLTTDTA